jgi:hypothetical protein
MSAKRFAQQAVANETEKPLKSLAHVSWPSGKVDARRPANSEHGLCRLQRSEQPVQRGHVKLGLYFYSPPTRHYNGQSGIQRVRRAPYSCDFHLDQTVGRRDPLAAVTISLLGLSQMACQSGQTQASLSAKIDPPHPAAAEFLHQFLNLCPGTSFGFQNCTFSAHPGTSTQKQDVEQVG